MNQPHQLPAWPRLLMRRNAAAYLDMSETKFQELVDSGQIASPSQIGRMVRWRLEDLNAFVDELPRRDEVPSGWEDAAA